MAATAFSGCISTIKSSGYKGNPALQQECGNSSLWLTAKGLKIDREVLGKNRYCSRKKGSFSIQASSIETPISDLISTPLNTKVDSPMKSSMVTGPLLV